MARHTAHENRCWPFGRWKSDGKATKTEITEEGRRSETKEGGKRKRWKYPLLFQQTGLGGRLRGLNPRESRHEVVGQARIPAVGSESIVALLGRQLELNSLVFGMERREGMDGDGAGGHVEQTGNGKI